MRIAFLGTSSLDYPSPRGRWLPLAQELAKLGHAPQLLLLHHTYDQLPIAQRRQEHAGVVVHYVGQMHVYGPVGQRRYYRPLPLLYVSLLGSAALALAAFQVGADIVHVCKPQPINGLAGVLAAQGSRRQLCVDCDDYEAGGNRFGAAWQQRVVQFWEDQLPQVASAVTVNTRFLEQRYVALGVPAARIQYVPNGVAPARLNDPPPRQVAGLRSALGVGSEPLVVYVGTLSKTTHNVDLLLDAFALVAERVPTARLLLVGDGEDRHELERRAAALGLGARALFVGAVAASAVPTFLALATCSVDPVADDAVARARSPLKIVESLALGVPIVTGDVGDRSEMLREDAGVLVTPGSAEALANGIIEVVENQQGRAQLAAAARKRSAAYRWDRLALQWLNMYH